MVPAEKLTWQPTPEVRTFARLFAHIVDDNNFACSAIAGVTPPTTRMDTGNEKDGWAANKMTKADSRRRSPIRSPCATRRSRRSTRPT